MCFQDRFFLYFLHFFSSGEDDVPNKKTSKVTEVTSEKDEDENKLTSKKNEDDENVTQHNEEEKNKGKKEEKNQANESRGRRSTRKNAIAPVKKPTKPVEEDTVKRPRGRPKRSEEPEKKPEPKTSRTRSKKSEPVEDTKKVVESDVSPQRGRRKREQPTPKEEPSEQQVVESEIQTRGRPKRSTVTKKEEAKNEVIKSGKKGSPKKPKQKPKKKSQKSQAEHDNPDDVKNAQILAEIEAEIAEINGTKKKKSPAKRKSSATVTQQLNKAVTKDDKNRPALEGFELVSPNKRRRSDSKTMAETEVPSELMYESLASEQSTRHSTRKKKTSLKAAEYGNIEDESFVGTLTSSGMGTPGSKKAKKTSAKKPTKSDDKKSTKSTSKRQASKSKYPEDLEGESILLDSLEGAINSASSLLDGSSDSSQGEGEAVDEPVVVPKQSRSGRNVRSPRRPMEADFETDFSVLRKAMNATTATSDVSSRKRRNSSGITSPPQRLPVIIDYDLGYEQRSDTARTRTFDENIKEKNYTLMDISGAADSGYLEMEPPDLVAKAAAPKKQRKSTSATEMKGLSEEKSVFKRHKSSSKQPKEKKDRSLLTQPAKRTVSDSDVMDVPLTPPIGGPKISRDLLEFEMTPPPTNPIIPSDDHSYSLSSRYYADQTAALSQASSSELFDDAGEGTSSVAVETLPVGMMDDEPSTSAGGASSPPNEIVIYVGNKPTVVPVMQDESGMSVITLPNGLASEQN